MCTVQQILLTLCESVFGKFTWTRDEMPRSIMQRITEDNICVFAWLLGWGDSIGCTDMIWTLLRKKKTAVPSRHRAEIAGGSQKYLWH